jgi:hypothetical protein
MAALLTGRANDFATHGGDLQHLSRLDLVRIRQLIAIRVEDLLVRAMQRSLLS